MTHDDARPEFVRPAGAPKGKSPQRVIQRPRIPDPTWSRSLAKGHRIGRPIGHVLTELLDQWLAEDESGPDRTDRDRTGGPDRTTDLEEQR